MTKYILSFLLIPLLLQARTVSIDTIMPQNVQKETGVNELTPKQQTALALWLEDHIDKTTTAKINKSTLTISQNIDNGTYLILSDGSMWQIDPTTKNVSSVWLLPFPIKLRRSSVKAYPTQIIDKNSGVYVNALRIEKMPSGTIKSKSRKDASALH